MGLADEEEDEEEEARAVRFMDLADAVNAAGFEIDVEVLELVEFKLMEELMGVVTEITEETEAEPWTLAGAVKRAEAKLVAVDELAVVDLTRQDDTF